MKCGRVYLLGDSIKVSYRESTTCKPEGRTKMRNYFSLFFLVAVPLAACQSQVVFQKTPEIADPDLVINNVSSAGDIFAMPVSKLIVKLGSVAADGANQAPVENAATDKKPAADSGGILTPQKIKSGTTSISIGSAQYSVTILPVESARRFLVRPVDNFFSSTSINITKIPNTDLPTAISVQFTDNIKTRISQLGGLVTAFIGASFPLLASDSDTECGQDQKLESFTLMIDKEVPFTKLSSQPCWEYSIMFEDPKPTVGAISWERFEKELGKKVCYFPVPACRDVVVTLVHANRRKPVIITAKIADPSYVRLAPLPVKGQITMHPICGADITETSGDRFGSYIDEITEGLKQVKAIEGALKDASSH